MSPAKVYFIPLSSHCIEEAANAAKLALEKLIHESGTTLNPIVPIKVHFGEKGNTTFVPATCYDGIIDALAEGGATSAFIETNVLYRGSRTTREAHTQLAHAHGFTRIPVIIADGDRGEAYDEITIDKEHFKQCKIGSGFAEFSQIVVTSHFKGHAAAGFGGALKQLSMGFAARGGKMAQHAKMVPTVQESKCTACGLCVKKCDVNAISLAPKAKVDETRCIGCAGCIAVCPVGAVRNDWAAENFKEKIAEYAYGAQLNKTCFYINFLMNITKECDCMGMPMEKVAEDIGVLASFDPVALDQACLDLLQTRNKNKLFEEGTPQLAHAEKIGLGTRSYTIEHL